MTPIRVLADPWNAGAVEYTASRLPVAMNPGLCLAEVVPQSSSDGDDETRARERCREQEQIGPAL